MYFSWSTEEWEFTPHCNFILGQPTKKQSHFSVSLDNHFTPFHFCSVQFSSVQDTPIGVPSPSVLLGLDCDSPGHCFNFHVDLVVFVLMTSPQPHQPPPSYKYWQSLRGFHIFIAYSVGISEFEAAVAALKFLCLQSNCHSWQLSIRNGGWNVFPQQWETTVGGWLMVGERLLLIHNFKYIRLPLHLNRVHKSLFSFCVIAILCLAKCLAYLLNYTCFPTSTYMVMLFA